MEAMTVHRQQNHGGPTQALFAWAGNGLDWKETLLDRTLLDEIHAHTLAAFV